MLISICMCTYKRDHLRNTLESIENLVVDENVSLEIIIVDNDVNMSATTIVNEFKKTTRHSVIYISEPRKNISHARNAYLTRASGEWLACLDDDEVADKMWLQNLLHAAKAHEADVVFGVVKPVYPESCPQWIKDGKFFVRKEHPTGTQLSSGGAGCTLVKRSSIKGHLFDPEYGRTGGEDSNFFHQMHLNGYKLIYCNTAFVTEEVEPNRVNLGYLAKRSYRVGQTFTKYRYADKGKLAKFKYMLSCIAKIGAYSVLTLGSLPFGRAVFSNYYVSLMGGLGKFSYLVNNKVHKQYG